MATPLVNPQTGLPYTQDDIDAAKMLMGQSHSQSYTTRELSPEYKEQYNQLSSEYDAATQAAAEADQLNLATLKERLARQQAVEPGVDVRPLAALLDQWQAGYGVKTNNAGLADAYAQQEAARKQGVLGTEKELREATSGMSASQLKALKDRMASLGMMTTSQTKAETAKANAERSEKNRAGIDRRADENKLMQLSDRMKEFPTLGTKIQRITSIIPETGAIPGVGVGENAFKDFMRGEKGSAVRQDAEGIVAALIKIQSGMAASDLEVARKMGEYGLTASSKEDTFRRGLKNLKQELLKEIQSKQAGFTSRVREQHKREGGLLTEDYKQMFDKKQSANVTVTNGKETLSIPRSDLPDAIADGYKEVK